MSDEQAHAPTPSEIAAAPPLPASYTQDPELPNGLLVSSYGRRFVSSLLEAVLIVVTLLVGWVVWSAIVWRQGQSPAKQLMGMRVVDARTGEAAGWSRMFMREFWLELVLFTAVSALTLGIIGAVGILLIFAGDLRQTGWDRMVGTTVADDRTGIALSR